MRKAMGMCLAALMAAGMLTGCGGDAATAPEGGTAGKVVVNIEGTVSSVSGREIALENGQVVVISEDTVFAGDPDTNSQVDDIIQAGNFIQGYTSDDPSGDRVTAVKIWTNMPQRTGGKLAIDFEGAVASVDDGRVTLESGQVIVFDEKTIFTNAEGVVEHVELAEGVYIQGSTEDDPAGAEVTAQRIHIVVF